MDGDQPVNHVEDRVHRPVQFQRTALVDPVSKGPPRHQLHDDVGLPLFLAGAKDERDPGMRNFSCQLGFPQESGHVFTVSRDRMRQAFESDPSTARYFLRFPDDSHAAGAQPTQQFVSVQDRTHSDGLPATAGFHPGGDGDVFGWPRNRIWLAAIGTVT